ncbi:MAG: SDR family oxidoreductase [Candidatus Binataceae bacterium]|jgi:NAD(P)-dependent dehydrogenase (short-subunit alcohol dehydrogenase family)
MHDIFGSMFSVRGKKALVTGGALGIGRACATALAMGGADVVIVDKDEKAGRKTAESIKDGTGVDTSFFKCDVSDQREVQAVVSRTVERFGRLDVAVNNAGVASAESEGIQQSQAAWDKIIGINLTGLWFCAQAQAMQMCSQIPGGGKIINIASAAARNASGDGAYCASKAGVVQLTRSLAMQLGGNNINVNSISPGVVMTRLLATLSPAERARLREITPMGYIARPRDIYGAVLFLASAASDFVTSHDLLTDGGRTLSTWPLPERHIPPRVSESEEIEEMKADLETLDLVHGERKQDGS